MKKNKYTLWLIIILILITTGIIMKIILHKDENLVNQKSEKLKGSTKSILNYDVKQISVSTWNETSGLPFSQVPGANLGATSFEVIDKNRIAYLCNSTSEIIITNNSTGKSIEKFQVIFAPRDFIYENGIFYVLSEYEVTLYDEIGNVITKCPFPIDYKGVERLKRYNDATYLLLPSGNSLMVEDCGSPIEPIEFKGIITDIGKFILSQITGHNSYSIKVTQSKDKIFERTFTTDKKVAGIFIVGATNDRIIIDVQTYISENPIKVERIIGSIVLSKDGLGDIIYGTKVPDCYHVISNKDFDIAETGNIYNMISSPKGVFIFLLSETNSKSTNGYPSSLIETKTHANDNLIKLD